MARKAPADAPEESRLRVGPPKDHAAGCLPRGHVLPAPRPHARELRALDSPDQAAFYTSGRASNEAAFVYQLFVRLLGTNNLPDCSDMCHESSGAALTETIGIGKGSIRLEDLYEADLILVVGQNPGTKHSRMLSALETAKDRGARTISVNPLPEAGLLPGPRPCRRGGGAVHGGADGSGRGGGRGWRRLRHRRRIPPRTAPRCPGPAHDAGWRRPPSPRRSPASSRRPVCMRCSP